MTSGNQGVFVQNPKLDQILKQLESNSAQEKFAAMKKVVAMMSKGSDVEQLFPNVVKNVVCKHIDVKKLVYTYLIHYAEKQQDEALLSVNNFQKDLTDKNQFFRALALRVMSSIRVPLIAQIVVASIKKCSSDMSPFVRKAACLAIPKAYHLDKETKPELIEVIEKLLSDTNTMVLGAAVFAFNEVCPTNYELLHPHYRKLCKYLVDCDEWGQVVIINTLLRYARTQFLNPFKDDAYLKQRFYEDEEDESADPLEDKSNPITYDLDVDHRLLLKSALPLLRARNAAVVLAVASLYFHIAPLAETGKIVRPLLRLVNTHRENQSIVLANIATMTKEKPYLFQPYIKDFYVFSTDSLYAKTMKLEILSLLANEANIHTLLKELKSYLKFPDENFVTATIQAIGRMASMIPEVTEMCVAGLMNMIKHKSEKVVAEAVIVAQHLLQKNPEEYSKVISKLACLLEHVKVPVARACIVWMIGEYQEIIPKIGPDALRIIAKNFIHESDVVKLQGLTLGAKLFLKQGQKVSLLFQYIMNLAKFDQNYDIRDRARFIRTILFDSKGNCPKLHQRSKDIIFNTKISSTLQSHFHERSRFSIGSLSHVVNHHAIGYEPLPDFPEEQPDPSVRKTFDDIPLAQTQQIGKEDLLSDDQDFFKNDEDDEDAQGLLDEDEDAFYGKDSDEEDPFAEDDEEEEEEEEEDDEEGDNDEEEDGEEEEEEEEEGDENEAEEEEEDEEDDEVEEEDDDDGEDEGDEENDDEEDEEVDQTSTNNGVPNNLLDFNDAFLSAPVSIPSNNTLSQAPNIPISNVELPRKILLDSSSSDGLHMEYQFSRNLSSYGPHENLVRLYIQNHGNSAIEDIGLIESSSEGRMIKDFAELGPLAPGASTFMDLSIDFNSSPSEYKFTIGTKNKGTFQVSLTPPIGELICSMPTSTEKFKSDENSLSFNKEIKKVNGCSDDMESIAQKVQNALNANLVELGTNEVLFSAKVRSKELQQVLIRISKHDSGAATVSVSSPKTLFAHSLCNQIASVLSQ